MRGETDRLVDTGLIEGTVVDLVARAANAMTVVDAQRLVAELRDLAGVHAAEIVPALRPVAGDLDLLLRLPVGPAQWGHELRVEFSAAPAFSELRPAANEIAAAADRTLTRACRPAPPRWADGNALLRALTSGARAVILVLDPAAGWSAMSDSFGTVLGYDRGNPPDCRLIDLVHPDDRPAAVATLLTCCAGRHPTEPVDLRVSTVTGDWRTMEVVARSFVDDPEVGVVAFFAIDVTAQRQAEQAALLERRRLAKLVETIGDGILLLDEAGQVMLANQAAHRLLDLGAPLGVDGYPLTWTGLLDSLGTRLDGGGRLDRLRRWGTGGPAAGAATVGEELSLTDGRVLELDLVPVTCADAKVVGTLVHLRDATARVTTRRGLEERSRGLEERNRALVEATALNNQFVASVAHELRGPLSSVVAFSHLLGDASSGELSEDQRTYVDVIDRNANRLLRLIEDLLLLSRLEARTLHLKPVPTRLPELLTAAVAERMPVAQAANIELTVETLPGPDIVCDDTRVHQVVDNLLNNALKFTPGGGRVAVTGRPLADGWTVEVADSGVGIPAGDLPRLFSSFFRGSNVSAAVGRQVMPGTGLGLVVSRAIVELHGGTISVASTEGVGTTVTLSLPARPARSGG